MSRGAQRTTRQLTDQQLADHVCEPAIVGTARRPQCLGQTCGVDFRYWTVTVAVEVVRPNSFVALSV